MAKTSRQRSALRPALVILGLAGTGLAAFLLLPHTPGPPRVPPPPVVAVPEPEPLPPEPPPADPSVCRTEPHVFRHGIRDWSRDLALPARGRFVEEAHYVTREDSFGDRLFPDAMDHRIELHLHRALRLYRRFDPQMTHARLFPSRFARVWTPSEGGHIGQGSVGRTQLERLRPEDELWLVTMQWLEGHRPPIGTKLLLKAGDRQVVVVAGFETGPEQEKYLGGVSPEVHRWLGTHNQSTISAHYLSDPDFPTGPTRCEIVTAEATPAQREKTRWAVKSTQ